MDTFEDLYRRIGVLKRRRAALEADLRAASAHRLAFREAIMDRIQCTDSELDEAFQVMAIPGHTLGHLAYFSANCLFCGDTLFAGGCGRVFEGTPAQMHDSLSRLAALPDQTRVYCGHEYTEANLRFALAVESGNRRLQDRVDEVAVARAKGLATVPSTLALEKATNPFLRCSVPEVIASARAHGAVSEQPTDVFHALREWKNGF